MSPQSAEIAEEGQRRLEPAEPPPYPKAPWRYGGLPLTRRIDAVVLAIFFLLAVMHHAGRFGGAYPFPSAPPLGDFVFLDSDGANIASFAAALDSPELFEGDEVLSDRRNFRIYSTVHIPILRALATVTGNYGTAFSSLLGAHVFVQAVGFYLLGVVVFRSRYWAALLGLVTLMPVELNLGEYWGIWDVSQPRFSFQALLPFLLAGAFYWRTTPKAWPWLMGLAGLLIYVHPVSAPVWAFALWCGFWAHRPPSWSLSKRFGFMVLLGLVFLIVAAPFLLHYLQNHAHGTPELGVSYERVREVFAVRIGYLDPRGALNGFARLWRYQLLYWAWAGVGMLILLRRREDRRGAAQVGLWTAGLLFVAFVIPLVEHAVAAGLRVLPVEHDLVRGIRYTVPIMLVFCLWPLAALTRATAPAAGMNGWTRKCLYAAGAAVAAVWIWWYRPATVVHTLSCWRQRELVCEYRTNVSKLAEALAAVRSHTPPGARILPTEHGLYVRYHARRAVVYDWKDGGILGYTNHAALLNWYERYLNLRAIREERDPKVELRRLLSYSATLGANYVLIDTALDPEIDFTDPELAGFVGENLLWSNNAFALIGLPADTRAGASH